MKIFKSLPLILIQPVLVFTVIILFHYYTVKICKYLKFACTFHHTFSHIWVFKCSMAVLSSNYWTFQTSNTKTNIKPNCHQQGNASFVLMIIPKQDYVRHVSDIFTINVLSGVCKSDEILIDTIIIYYLFNLLVVVFIKE